MATLNDRNTALVERQILEEIANVSKQLADLSMEKEALERMLLRARQQNALLKRTDVSRKNSVNRVLAENSVLQALHTANRSKKVAALYTDARLIHPALKMSTFRSILHRMKGRGLIESAEVGHWQITAAGRQIAER